MLICFLFCIAANNNAQVYTVRGKVVDKSTKATLPFVNLIVTGNPRVGTTADIDGNFKLTSSVPITSLSFSYVGYQDLILPINDTAHNKYIVATLQPEAYQLGEVKIKPGINPALRIIQAAIDNKDRNNPEKMHSFDYYSYNKLYCTADFKGQSDTINSLDSAKRAKDTTAKKIYNFLQGQYLFLIESVSERKFLYPDHNYERIIAERTSGFKESPFALAANQIQSFSFYPEYISILGEEYLNPISSNGIKRYSFLIEDTIYQGKDTVFVISFHPQKDKKFDAMKGAIYINTNGYAVQNVLATPIRENNFLTVTIQQKYDYVQNRQWFPVQLNTDCIYNNIEITDSIRNKKGDEVNPDDEHNKLKVVTRSYIKDIVLDTELRQRDFGRVEVEIAPDASKKQDDFWKQYRNDTLSAKEKKTYHVIDSFGQAMHLDRKLKWLETLADGKLRMGFIDIDMDKIVNINLYEGYRLGLGFHTNNTISRYVSIGGYGAYGTQDNAFKYGGDINFLFDPYSEIKLNASYKNDVIGAGTVSFFNDGEQSIASPQDYYAFFINNMDKMQEEKVSFSFDALKYFQFNLFGDEQIRQATNNYEYGITENNVTLLYNRFDFTEMGLQLRFAYKEKFLKSPIGMTSLGTKYPVLWFNITKGFNNLLNGEFSYLKYDLKISKDFDIRFVGVTSVTVFAGYLDGSVPYTLLYNARATYDPRSLAINNSFETMRINEFASNRYVNLFLSHDFGSLLFKTEKFKPHFKIVTDIGFGTMDNVSNNYNMPFRTMEKGYYESGLEINHLLHFYFISLGAGVYYRYGPYTLSPVINNFVLKFTFYTSL